MLSWKIDTNTLSLILTTIIHVALWVYGMNQNLLIIPKYFTMCGNPSIIAD